MSDAAVERFRPASGRETGVLGLALVTGLVVVAALQGLPLWVFGGCVVTGLLMWAAFLRPAVRIDHADLVLRSMFATTRLPLAAIEEVRIGHTLAVVVGERRYVSPAVGRPRLRFVRAGGSGLGGGVSAQDDYAGYVERRIRAAVESSPTGEVGVRRSPAYVEIAVLVVGLVLLGVGLVVA